MKKLFSLIMVLLIGASLFTACMDKEKAPASAPVEAGQKAPVEVSFMMVVESEFQTENNPVALAFEKATNVRLKFYIAPQSSYLEKIQIMLASEADMPDMFYMPNGQGVMHKYAIEQGIILPLDDYLKNAPNIIKYTDPNSWPSMKLTDDGKIYGLPKATQNRQDGFL